MEKVNEGKDFEIIGSYHKCKTALNFESKKEEDKVSEYEQI
jgi:WD40 repeat protein